MNTISALFSSTKLPPPPQQPSPLQSNLTATTNTPTMNLPQPPFANSINELRNLSAALSTFLNRYDELNNHLSFIKSSIDSKLPEHLIEDTVNLNQSPFTRLIESFCDRNVTDGTETVALEQNPNGTVSDCERSCENLSVHDRPSYLNNFEVNDVLENFEEFDVLNKVIEADTDVLKDCEGIDVSNKLLETDTLMIDGEIDVSNKLIESDTDVLIDSERINVSRKLVEADSDVLKDSEAVDVSNKVLETDTLKIDVEIDVSKNYEEIEVSNKLLETETLKFGEETDVSKKVLETDTDVFKDSEQFDVSIELLETDILNIAEKTDVLKIDEEVDALKKHEKADTLKIDEETDVLKMDEVIVILVDHEKISKEDEQTDILMNKEEIDTSMNHEELETSMNNDEIDILNQHEETDSSMDHEEIDSLRNNVEADFSKKQEEIDSLKKQEDTDDVKKHEEIFVSRKRKSRKSLKKHVEADISKKHAEGHISKNPLEIDMEENDVSKKHKETGDLKRYEEIVVSRKPESSNFPKKHEEIVVLGKPESRNSPKKHEETDISKKHEEIDISKNSVEIDVEENDVSKKHKEKKLEEFVISKKHEEIDLSKKPKEYDHLKPEEIDVRKKHEATDNLKKIEKIDISKKHEETDVLKKHEKIAVSKKHEEIDTLNKSAYSELETLCARMDAKGMRKYLITHITDMKKLREELPKALKLARDPAKLVLDSIGRFFLQAGKTFHSGRNHHQQAVSRLASVMILECFVMISGDGIEISKEDKAYAADAAVRWKQRMVKEGGVRRVEEADARGLLLLISGFGIQDRDFKIVDIRDLIMACKVKEISAALRRSIILIPKIPEVIDKMVKNNLEIEAADAAYTFGLEDKCHPLSILTIFMRRKIRDIQNSSPLQMLLAMKQQLSDLKSVKQCLEFHKVEPSNVLAVLKINEKIRHLEKEINNRNLTSKRKSTEPEFLKNPIHHEAKRPCVSHGNMPQRQNPIVHHPMNPYNQPTDPRCNNFNFNHGLAHSYGTYVNGGTIAGLMAHSANVLPYFCHGNPPHIYNHMGQPNSTQSQTNASQPYGMSPLISFPGIPARQAPASDLYSFADKL